MLLTNGERSHYFQPWQSGTAALMALAITTGTTAPLLTTTPASAQLFHDNQLRSQSQLGLPSQSDTSREKIVIAPKETMPLTLTVAAIL